MAIDNYWTNYVHPRSNFLKKFTTCKLVLNRIVYIFQVYHVRIAFLAYTGYEGFSFEDIPEFN
jgi:hypothetical protein